VTRSEIEWIIREFLRKSAAWHRSLRRGALIFHFFPSIVGLFHLVPPTSPLCDPSSFIQLTSIPHSIFPYAHYDSTIDISFRALQFHSTYALLPIATWFALLHSDHYYFIPHLSVDSLLFDPPSFLRLVTVSFSIFPSTHHIWFRGGIRDFARTLIGRYSAFQV